jgi:hypothetical protein
MEEQKVFTLQEVSDIAEQAAERAIANLMSRIDIDVDDKKAMIRFRENLKFVDEQREGQLLMKQAMKKGVLYLIGVALMGIMYLSWDVVKTGMKTMFMSWLGGP